MKTFGLVKELLPAPQLCPLQEARERPFEASSGAPADES